MGLEKNQTIHDLNSLIVKIKSIADLLIHDSNDFDKNQMIQDGDKTLDDLLKLWNSIKKEYS